MEYLEDYAFDLHYHSRKADVVTYALSQNPQGIVASLYDQRWKMVESLHDFDLYIVRENSSNFRRHVDSTYSRFWWKLGRSFDNNHYQSSIQMAPSEALYGRPCRSPVYKKRFGKIGKLSPKFVGPFEILERIGEVAYKLALPPQLSNVRDVFLVILQKYEPDPTHVLD
ncbi:hypothetical protein L3X38_026488 [Prunus dulcis]|uniref:Tf2-1-like SH3-like domain-containing protein n=1 Tax=Prunus dulcis TaxID=3755 RepID=A0AAD4VNM6_PRUDU|nr:hypothetical protein L3X38_026488 [Prunus dulcis]